jgi:hypothetical protein
LVLHGALADGRVRKLSISGVVSKCGSFTR